MAVKTKAKPKTQLPPTPVKHSSSSLLLKNKKLSLVIGILLVAIVILAFLFKSIFIAAMVNGEPISRVSVVTSLEKQGGKAILESLITKKLILQEAKKKNITVTQADIDTEIKKIEANLKTQGTTLDQALSTQGMTRSALSEELKVQVSIYKLVGKDIPVTDKEINDFVTANKAQMAEGTTEEQFRKQATEQLKQQKLQSKIQEFIKGLQDKAKVVHFVSY